jgi:hypothetical protein
MAALYRGMRSRGIGGIEGPPAFALTWWSVQRDSKMDVACVENRPGTSLARGL